MKKSVKIVAMLCAAQCSMLTAGFQFRSPENHGIVHWPFGPTQDAWWSDMMPGEKNDRRWCLHTSTTGYTRSGHEAYFNPDKNKNTRKTAPLSVLFFGKDTFRGEEAFTNGTFAGASTADQLLLNQTNPFLGFARISPRFDYNEFGAHWGVDFSYRLGDEEQWHVGGRVNIPFKVIEIEQDNTCKLEELIGDVVRFRTGSIDGANAPDYAARLDFVTALILGGIPAVNFAAPGGTVTAFGVPISGVDNGAPAGIEAAYVIKSNNGELPLPKPGFKKQPSQVSGSVGADGSGADGSALFFLNGVNYNDNLAKDREALGTLFLVPRKVNDPSVDLVGGGATIGTAIFNNLAQSEGFDEPASEFFRVRGIDLCMHERITAVGDIDFEVYGGYGKYDHWYVDGMFGIRAPSGKRQKDSNRLFFQSTGHNGHAEIKLAIEGGWMPCDWFAFKLDGSFHHAFKRTQKVAAPFKGATIRDIGPPVDAKVSWSYFTLHVDFNLFHPHNPELGCMFGYELFAKRKDKVKLAVTTATDLLGRLNQPLDETILEIRTNTMAHKIRGQGFHRFNYFEIFAGASHIVAGRSAMKETEGHIGFAVYF